jgi:multicomponent Na+:H+ antiporter subunit G
MIADILLLIGALLVILGMVGIFVFKDLYARILTSSMIDSAATVAIMVALMIKVGWNTLTLKLFIILAFLLITSPVSNHLIASSAHLNGIETEEEYR